MKHIIVVNGQGGVGKDTFCMYAIQHITRSYKLKASNISSVDEVKGYGRLLGWDGVKDEKGRKFLSDLKEISTRYNGPMKYMSDHIDNGGSDVVFVHIREPEEIDSFLNVYPNAITILVKANADIYYGNESDDGVSNYNYDHYIYNKLSKKDLKQSAIKFVDSIISF